MCNGNSHYKGECVIAWQSARKLIEQANQENRQDHRHSQHASKTKCQMHSNFCIFKIHVRFNLVVILDYLQY